MAEMSVGVLGAPAIRGTADSLTTPAYSRFLTMSHICSDNALGREGPPLG